ncbi:MAG: hypothetical protein EU532_02710 [Promethearchaeota archaeon]|nr:MAG: hypothetical protein EU532_02710 [Candidatus Lokiarchaeota archaeon]
MIEQTEQIIIDTRITDQWGVDWSAMEIVRDFLQNFYDANPINDIKIIIKKRTVTVHAPAEFDYKSLIYLGSDKGNEDIGQYGEGFKAATLNAMRNHHCIVHVHIKDKLLEFYFQEEEIGDTLKKVIMCRLKTVPAINGSKLILTNCSAEIVEEFKFGLNYFYYPENALFGTQITKSRNDIFIYRSLYDDKGYVFYRKLLRSKLDVPLVIVCNRRYKSIDEKIKHDRDRKAFNEKVLELLLRYVLKQVWYEAIIPLLEPWWANGHMILRILSSGYRHQHYSFPDNYYAKHSRAEIRDYEMQMKVDQLEREFQKKGDIQCPGYMAKLGMKNATSIIRERMAEIKRRHHTLYTRKPTELEVKALNLLKDYIKNIDSILTHRYSHAHYTIGDSEEIVGQLRVERSYRSNDIFLSKYFFLKSFSKALAILIHEWSHIYGFDGSRTFTDALTALMAGIIKQRHHLDEIEEKWNNLSRQIRAEQGNSQDIPQMHLLVDKLSEDQKAQLLKSIPEDELLKLMEKEKIELLER